MCVFICHLGLEKLEICMQKRWPSSLLSPELKRYYVDSFISGCVGSRLTPEKGYWKMDPEALGMS